VTFAKAWQINADEQIAHDCNQEFKAPAVTCGGLCPGDPYDGTTPYRSSDHDPALVGQNIYKTTNGTAGADTLTCTPGDDILTGGPGADRTTGGAGQPHRLGFHHLQHRVQQRHRRHRQRRQRGLPAFARAGAAAGRAARGRLAAATPLRRAARASVVRWRGGAPSCSVLVTFARPHAAVASQRPFASQLCGSTGHSSGAHGGRPSISS